MKKILKPVDEYEFITPYKKFADLCKQHGVTPYYVAQITGVAGSTLYAWKAGDYVLKLGKLCFIAEYFGVPVDYFIEKRKKK